MRTPSKTVNKAYGRGVLVLDGSKDGSKDGRKDGSKDGSKQ